MTMYKKTILAMAATTVLFAGHVQAEEPMGHTIELPGIPLRALDNKKPTAATTPSIKQSEEAASDRAQKIREKRNAAQAKREFDQDFRLQDRKPLELEITPGVNTLISVSKGRLNRFVTPFESPIIRTVSDIEVLQENNVVYATTNSAKPISMFITDQTGTQALSLTLIPKAIPPREVRMAIKVPQGQSQFNTLAMPSKKAEKFERSRPYVESVTDVLKTVAIGDVPSGYTLRHPAPEDFTNFYCELPGFTSVIGQVIDGAAWQVGVSRVKNETNSVIEIGESDCLAYQRLAVAVYPSAVVKPGRSAELYIVRKRQEEGRIETRRPHLHID